MAVQQGFPNLDTPLVDANGALSLPWFQFFAALWNRTGASKGNATSVAFDYPDSSGNPGQFLTSEGTGNPTIWTTPVARVSQLTNDAGYVTSEDLSGFSTQTQTDSAIASYVVTHESVNAPPSDSSVGSPGSSTRIARADHVHPREFAPAFGGTVSASLFQVHGATWSAGTGTPSAAQPNGSLYSRTDGTLGNRLYVCDGIAWRAVASV